MSNIEEMEVEDIWKVDGEDDAILDEKERGAELHSIQIIADLKSSQMIFHTY